jgi:L-lactate dehydrogenase (cytochrome)
MQVSANASVGFEELARDTPNHTLFYQVYVNKDRAKTEAQLRRVAKAGYKGICATVDAPVAGKRERDERCQLDADSVRPCGSHETYN